ncbi:MAG: hypothetical protein K6C32_05260 [Bacilli bacterium]|nr:hypothetical protein [Bacilli bacterium]
MLVKKCHFCKYWNTAGLRCGYRINANEEMSEQAAINKGACEEALKKYQEYLMKGDKTGYIY